MTDSTQETTKNANQIAEKLRNKGFEVEYDGGKFIAVRLTNRQLGSIDVAMEIEKDDFLMIEAGGIGYGMEGAPKGAVAIAIKDEFRPVQFETAEAPKEEAKTEDDKVAEIYDTLGEMLEALVPMIENAEVKTKRLRDLRQARTAIIDARIALDDIVLASGVAKLAR